MMDTSQKFEDMQNNLSFEIQKMRFFNSLFKYNLFFELGLDVQEWTDKVFEHCCKMILLAVSSNLKTDTQSQIHRKYEITENFSQEFTSQKSVFDLHFWYKRVIGREANTTFHNSEETKSEAIDETTSNTILTQAFRTLHYFVEVRHKYLCASTSDKIHEKHWNGKLKSEAGEYLDQQHITDESNKISATVLEEIKTRAENNHKIRFPTVNELFTTMANRLESTGENAHNGEFARVTSSFEEFLYQVLNINLKDTCFQQSCVTLIAKVQSESTLRIRKLEKAQLTSSRFVQKMTSAFSGIFNNCAFDLRCVPGVTTSIQDLTKYDEPELISDQYTSIYTNINIVACYTQIKNFSYMNYFLDNVYNYLMRNYLSESKAFVEPNAQDSAVTLKLYDNLIWLLHRYKLFLHFTTLDFINHAAAKHRLINLQPIVFTKIFSCLQAIVFKNEKMQKIMWKHKEFLVVENRGVMPQFGELDLISLIIDNPKLLLKANDLDAFSEKLFKRISTENYQVIIRIFAKLSKATMNNTISNVALDLATEGPIFQQMGEKDQEVPEQFLSACVILTNLMKVTS